MSTKEKYGNRNISKMYSEWDILRKVGRSEGTPTIQTAIDNCEEWIDFAFQSHTELTNRILQLEAVIASHKQDTNQ